MLFVNQGLSHLCMRTIKVNANHETTATEFLETGNVHRFQALHQVLALLSGIPIIGDILVLALGFYRTAPEWTVVLLLVGKFARFLIWNAVVGLF